MRSRGDTLGRHPPWVRSSPETFRSSHLHNAFDPIFYPRFCTTWSRMPRTAPSVGATSSVAHDAVTPNATIPSPFRPEYIPSKTCTSRTSTSTSPLFRPRPRRFHKRLLHSRPYHPSHRSYSGTRPVRRHRIHFHSPPIPATEFWS